MPAARSASCTRRHGCIRAPPSSPWQTNSVGLSAIFILLLVIEAVHRETANDAARAKRSPHLRDRVVSWARPPRFRDDGRAMAERFTFSFAPAYRLPARAFGITPATAWVDVGDGELDAHFGPCGVRISFRTKVSGLDPLGIVRHPELTVTVAEVDRLATLLR